MSAASLMLGLIGRELLGSVAIEIGSRAVRSLVQASADDDWGGGQLSASARSEGTPIHDTTRVRLTVPGLRNSPQRAPAIEQTICSLSGVSFVQASPVTGRVLVLYDSAATNSTAIAAALGLESEAVASF